MVKSLLPDRIPTPRLANQLGNQPTKTPLRWVGQKVSESRFLSRRRKLSDQLITDPTFNQHSMAYKRMNAVINRMKVTTVIALVGELFFFPLTYLAIGIILWNFSRIPARAFKKLRNGKVDVDMISSLTVITGIFSGYIVVTAFISLIFFYALREILRVKGDTHSKMINVFKQQPLFVWIVEDGQEVEIPFQTLQSGDTVVIPAGNVLPVDGTVIDGSAAVDQHMLTGESQPVERGIGEQVLASTVVISGKLYVRVEKAGDETQVAQIGNILNASIKKKSDVMLKSEELSDKSVPPTLVLSALMLPFFGLTGSFALLTSHFRRRPALFASVMLLNYFSILSDNRILVKDGRALDVLSDVDVVVFDKTGTLTTNQLDVSAIHSFADYDENTILRLVAMIEQRQNHPIAVAIIEAANERHIDIPVIDNIEYAIGFGLKAEIGDDVIQVGSRRFVEQSDFIMSEDIQDIEDEAYNEGHTLIFVMLNHTLIGAVELVPTIRTEASRIIDSLKFFGIKQTIIISGDHEQPTRKLAKNLNIDSYYAQTLPQEKAAIIQSLIDEGHVVCYIGDGINDAIALQTAQVSVSLSGASTVATDAAQVILLDESLEQLTTFFAYGLDYERRVQFMLYGVIGLGVTGMGTAVLPAAVTYSVMATIGSLLYGLLASMSPMVQYRLMKQYRLNMTTITLDNTHQSHRISPRLGK